MDTRAVTKAPQDIVNLSLIQTRTLPARAQNHGGETSGGARAYDLRMAEDALESLPDLKQAVLKAEEAVTKLEVEKNVPELEGLSRQINNKGVNYFLVPWNVEEAANRFPGDYQFNGKLVASTALSPGAPTLIYPNPDFTPTMLQWKMVAVHEALHRTLKAPLNGSESLVIALTDIIVGYRDPALAQKAIEKALKEAKPTLKISVGIQVYERAKSVDASSPTLTDLISYWDENAILAVVQDMQTQYSVYFVSRDGEDIDYTASITVVDNYSHQRRTKVYGSTLYQEMKKHPPLHVESQESFAHVTKDILSMIDALDQLNRQ